MPTTRPDPSAKVTHDIADNDEWTFDVLPEQVCFVVVKAREFDVKEGETDPDEGSNATDDHMIDVLEDGADDPVRQELVEFIGALNDDAQIDLVALAWGGRGDGGRGDWEELRQQATARHNARTAAYLLGLPLLADFLEEGLAAFGQSCLDLEAEHL